MAKKYMDMAQRVQELLQNGNQLSQKQVNNLFILACKRGELQTVRYLLTSLDLKYRANIDTRNGSGLRHACERGHLATVNYLLTSAELVQHASLHLKEEDAFRMACHSGSMELVDYLLNSTQLAQAGHTPIAIDAQDNWAIKTACMMGHGEIVKYLLSFPQTHTSHTLNWLFSNACANGHLAIVQILALTPGLPLDIHRHEERALVLACEKGYLDIVQFLTISPELALAGQHYPDIHAQESLALRTAASNNHLAIVKFFLESPQIQQIHGQRPDIHAACDVIFIGSHMNGKNQMVNYLAYEYNISITPHMEQYMSHHPELKMMFDNRLLNHQLQGGLPVTSEAAKKTKI